jgi:hypothetical protein
VLRCGRPGGRGVRSSHAQYGVADGRNWYAEHHTDETEHQSEYADAHAVNAKPDGHTDDVNRGEHGDPGNRRTATSSRAVRRDR